MNKNEFLTSITKLDGTFKRLSKISPLRYPGGKTKAIGLITQYLPDVLTKKIVSPFIGGASLEIAWANNLDVDDISQFFMHQASRIALDSLLEKMGIESKLAFSNIENIGNTVSSSIPILLKDYFSKYSLDRGSNILLTSFGVGYSWANLLASV